jgi:predicted GTPase
LYLVSTKHATEDLLTGSETLGTETLVSLLKNYCRSGDMKKSITVGIIGIPNVGKSSLINSLKRSKAVGVGATPGFTKAAQVSTSIVYFNTLNQNLKKNEDLSARAYRSNFIFNSKCTWTIILL